MHKPAFNRYFITGTDTEIGKTMATAAMLHHLNQRHISCVGLKPVASGCERTPSGLINDDARCLQQHSALKLEMKDVNPIRFEKPIAPHIAAANEGTILTETMIRDAITVPTSAQCTLIEGFGGWHVPLNDTTLMSEVVAKHMPHVILVVGLRLGCLNHALLSQAAIQRSGCHLVGWIANQPQNHLDAQAANLSTLKNWLQAPLLGCIPYFEAPCPKAAAQHLDTHVLDKVLHI